MHHYGWRNVKGRYQLEYLGKDEKIILKCILEKYGVKDWIGLN
jgi:hypothetical protein